MPVRRLLFPLLAVALCVTACAPFSARDAAGPVTYPETRQIDHQDNYHGTTVADPYRWLEELEADDTRSWIEAQNQVTFGFLEGIPERLVGASVIGIDADGIVQQFDRLIGFIRTQQGDGEAYPGLWGLRIQPCRLPIAGNRLLEAFLLLQRITKVAVHCSVRRIEGDRATVVRHRLVQIAGRAADHA